MQQHKTNMINEEWKKTQNDAPFVAFYDMHAVTFVLPDEMADVSIAGLQWFILIPQLNHIVFQTGRKHCGKRRNCSLRAISPFPAEFSKDLHCRHVRLVSVPKIQYFHCQQKPRR